MWKELERKNDVRFSDTEVKVGPLSPDECIELAIGLLGKDTEVIRRRAVEFATETRGNPFLLTELIGCFDAETDSFEPMPLNEVIAKKLERLPGEAGPLLDVIAVSGQALPLDEAAKAAGQAESQVATVTRMRNERLVRVVGPEDSPLIDTYHDRVRETVLARMGDERCQSLHRTLAEAIETQVGGLSPERVAVLDTSPDGRGAAGQPIPRVFDLAYHFDAAGETKKAWMFAVLAAEQARRQSALEVAVNNYAIAKRNAGQASNAVRYRIAAGAGEALMLLGRYEEATAELRDATDLLKDVEYKSGIDCLLGQLCYKQGNLNGGATHLERGLRRYRFGCPRR